jgi:ATP-dependent helicase HrpB
MTAIGRQMVKIPVHPRLARMLIESLRMGCVDQACLMAAMLSERDPFDRRETRGPQRGIPTRQVLRWDSDCLERLECLEAYLARRSYHNAFGELNRNAVSNIQSIAQQLRESLYESFEGRPGSMDRETTRESLMRCLLRGFPDRLAKRRSPGRSNGVMVGGKGVTLGPQSGVVDPEFFLCIDVDSGRGDALVRQASRVDRDWLNEGLEERDECFFHPTQKQVVARRQTVWMDLVLQETPTNTAEPAQVKAALFQAVRQHWDATFPKDNEQLIDFIERVNCLREWVPELELAPIDQAFLETVAEQLCENVRSLADVKSGAWLDWLKSKLTPDQLKAIEREAPSRIEVPSGSSIKIQYERGKPPILAVKIQEVFSLKTTPRIARNRVPILFHLLSPAMRPQQVTDDLASFWANGYPEIKKELKRRYPKHSWPDDPTTATPGRK